MTQPNQAVPLDLGDVYPSKNQPRMAMDKGVIAGVQAAIEANGGAYPQDMAITVRPRQGRGGYEILAGHHRAEAAEAAGCDVIWAWVRPMSDAEAALHLAASNNQNKLKPLEHGRHAVYLKEHHGVDFKAYAKATGRTQTQVYNDTWAWLCLGLYGGPSGPYANMNALVLAELYHMKDEAQRGQLLYQLWWRQWKPTQQINVIKAVKKGIAIDQAFAMVEAIIDQLGQAGRTRSEKRHLTNADMEEAKRIIADGLDPWAAGAKLADRFHLTDPAPPAKAAEAGDEAAAAAAPAGPRPGVDGVGFIASAAATLNDDYSRAMVYQVNLWRARADVLEAILADLGHTDKIGGEGFTQEVQARLWQYNHEEAKEAARG